MPIIDLMNIAEHDLVLVLHPSRHCYFLCRDQLHVSLPTSTDSLNLSARVAIFKGLRRTQRFTSSTPDATFNFLFD